MFVIFILWMWMKGSVFIFTHYDIFPGQVTCVNHRDLCSSHGKVVSEEKNFRNPPIRNNNCLWRACLLTNRDEMSNLYRSSMDASYNVPSVGSFGKAISEEKIVLEINGSEKRMACGGYVCWRIASYQVSIHLAKRFQRRRFFRNQPIRNKNGLCWPYIFNRSGQIDQSL